MKILPTAASICLGLIASTISVRAGATYADSLKAADTALGSQQLDVALTEIDAALSQSTCDGERALALAKKGYVLAFPKKDYAGARLAVDEALKVQGLAPVAKVTALQVLAECQMKGDKDFRAALPNLQAAMALEGVDWAKPALGLCLSDCYRSTGQLDQALDAYGKVLEMANVSPDIKAGAHLCRGFIYQYDRKDSAKAKEAYANAVQFRPSLQKEVEGHLSRLP